MDNRIHIPVVTRTLENETFLSEGLMLPDRAFYADSSLRSRIAAANLARRAVEDRVEDGLPMMPFPPGTDIMQIEIEIEPPARSPAWEHPVHILYDGVRWIHGDGMAAAYVPALGIVVLAEKPEALEKRVIAHIRFALFREDRAKSLKQLAQTQRATGIEVTHVPVKLRFDSAKKKAQEANEKHHAGELTTLRKIAVDLADIWAPQAYEVAPFVRRVAEALTGSRGGSVLLVGPSGVGKTAIVHQLVAERALHGLSGRPLYTTSGSRLVAGMGGFGMWQERLRNICREASKAQAILHVGGLLELMEVGKSMYNTIGMASFLRPYLLKGSLQIIAECTPEEIPVIERLDAHLLQAFQRVDIEEPDAVLGRDILLNVAVEKSSGRDDAITEDAIDLLDRLHRRYATYSAYPGRPVRFLTNLLKDAQAKSCVDTRRVLDAFSHETGIPRTILDEVEPLNLEATGRWFENRVMGQPEAVRQVIDLLAIVKTRLARPGKPLASLFFCGPTGVGKTELAKALAEFLFGDKDRLVRFDMSEYADPSGAARLIGGTADGDGQLTGKLRDQPFSVVLLDEFEKAHPATFDLLLQVLGEGRLSDIKGRVADFRNAVIIMTSNLGAAAYQKGPAGFMGAKENAGAKARQHFTGAVRTFLRPEMFNRIDAIVAFSPLDRETVLRIAQREISLIQRRDGLQLREVDLAIADDVAALLAERGFDPLYGARPLKRTAEAQLVTPLACGLNHYSDALPLGGIVSVTDGALHVDVFADQDKARKRQGDTLTNAMLIECAGEAATLRRTAYALREAGPVNDVENEIFRLTRLEKRARSKQHRHGMPPPDELKELPALRALAGDVKTFRDQAIELEDRFLLAFYQKETIDISAFRMERDRLRAHLEALVLRLYARQYSDPQHAWLAVFSEHRERMTQLAEAYVRLADGIAGSRITACWISVAHDSATGKRELDYTVIKNVAHVGPTCASENAEVGPTSATKKPNTRTSGANEPAFRESPHQWLFTALSNPPEHAIGFLMEIEAEMIYPLVAHEGGGHTFKDKNGDQKCLVQVSSCEADAFVPLYGIHLTGAMGKARTRRSYDCVKDRITDGLTKKAVAFPPDHLNVFIKDTLQAELMERAYELIGERDKA